MNLDSCLLWADSRDTWCQLCCPFPGDSPTQNRQKVVLQRPCTQTVQVTGRWVSSAVYGTPYIQTKCFSADMRQLETHFSANSLPHSWWTCTALSHGNVGCTRVVHVLDLCGAMTVSQLISQGFDPSPGTGSLQGPLRHPDPKTALWLSETYLISWATRVPLPRHMNTADAVLGHCKEQVSQGTQEVHQLTTLIFSL